MSTTPTFWSSLAQHWEVARKLRTLQISYDPDKCIGSWQCYEVCPVGCWTPNHETRKVEFDGIDKCVACGACVLQCKPDAIQLI